MLDRKTILVLLVVVVTAASCGGDPEPTYTVGQNRIMFEIPAGWEHVERDGGHGLHADGNWFVIRDLGTIDDKSLEAAVREARAMWRAGRYAEASAKLAELDLKRAMGTDDEKKQLAQVWPRTAGATAADKPQDVEKAYTKLLQLIAALPEVDIAELLDGVLWDLGQERDRGIASQEYSEVDGHRVLHVVTWKRLDHSAPQRFAFLQDQGQGLAVFTERGNAEDLEETFAAFVETIRFVPRASED